MRKIRYAMVVGLALVATGPVTSSPPPQTFDFSVCGTKATDIVVTDTDGLVLETWRGELRPGDTVRLGPTRLSPANALPWDCLRLRPARALSGLYHEYTSESLFVIGGTRPKKSSQSIAGSGSALPRIALWPTDEVTESELRLVLFLRKEGANGAAAVWLPADAPNNRIEIGYRFGGSGRMRRNTKDDFTTSTAWVEAGRVFVLQASADWIYDRDGPPLLTPIARDLKHFKSEVLALPAPLPVADTRNREVTPSPLTTLAGSSSWLWAAPKK